MENDKEGANNPAIDGKCVMLGLSFNSDEEAYIFYNLYAGTVGFSIRKNQMTKNKVGKITQRELTCSSQGVYHKKNTPIKKRADTRTGCEAMLEVCLNENGLYIITKFREEHNHVFEPLSRAHILRSQRNITEAQKELVLKMHEAGIGPTAIYCFFRAEAGGAKKLNFTRTDCNNLTQRHHASLLKKGMHRVFLNTSRLRKNQTPANREK